MASFIDSLFERKLERSSLSEIVIRRKDGSETLHAGFDNTKPVYGQKDLQGKPIDIENDIDLEPYLNDTRRFRFSEAEAAELRSSLRYWLTIAFFQKHGWNPMYFDKKLLKIFIFGAVIALAYTIFWMWLATGVHEWVFMAMFALVVLPYAPITVWSTIHDYRSRKASHSWMAVHPYFAIPIYTSALIFSASPELCGLIKGLFGLVLFIIQYAVMFGIAIAPMLIVAMLIAPIMVKKFGEY